MFDKEVEIIIATFLNDIRNFAHSLPELRPEPTKIPHTRPTKYVDVPHGEILSRWVMSQSPLSVIRDDYFHRIVDLGERTEACANYLRDTTEYKAPWMLSAFHILVSEVAQSEAGIKEFGNTPLARQLSMLPAYAKFGVNSPAAAFFSMLGVSARQMAFLLGTHYNRGNPDGYFDFSLMLDWILVLEPEQAAEWFKAQYGEDTAGQVSRLFRVIDSIRSREQSLEDISPLEVTIAGWQHYQGADVISQMVKGEEVFLRADPLNPWDAYAVAVFDKRGKKLGFIPRAYSRAVYNNIIGESPTDCTIASVDPSSKFRPVRIRLDIPET